MLGYTMKLIASSLFVAAVAFAGGAHAACSYPKAPASIPDGQTASQEQMLAAKKEVSKYNEDITAYTNCLQLESEQALAEMEKNAGTSQEDTQALARQKAEFERRQAQKHNAAIDEVTAVVERFNEQIRLYKDREKKESGG